MTNLNDYVTESEAARMVGVTAGKGSAWRHLTDHAPHIKQEKLFGMTAVLRSDLEAWCGNGRQQVVDAATKQKRVAMIRQLHRQVIIRHAQQKRASR